MLRTRSREGSPEHTMPALLFHPLLSYLEPGVLGEVLRRLSPLFLPKEPHKSPAPRPLRPQVLPNPVSRQASARGGPLPSTAGTPPGVAADLLSGEDRALPFCQSPRSILPGTMAKRENPVTGLSRKGEKGAALPAGGQQAPGRPLPSGLWCFVIPFNSS